MTVVKLTSQYSMSSTNSQGSEGTDTDFATVNARYVRRSDGVEVELINNNQLAYTDRTKRILLPADRNIDKEGYPDGRTIDLINLRQDNPGYAFTEQDIVDIQQNLTDAAVALRTSFDFDYYTELEREAEDAIQKLGFTKVEEFSHQGERWRYYEDTAGRAVTVSTDSGNHQAFSIGVKPRDSEKYYALRILMRAFPEMFEDPRPSFNGQLAFLKMHFNWLFDSDMPYRDRYAIEDRGIVTKAASYSFDTQEQYAHKGPSPDSVYTRLLMAIKRAKQPPKDQYVINGEPGSKEVELVLDLTQFPYTYHIQERGEVRNKGEFSNALDAAVFFYAKLFDVPSFRVAYRELSGEFEAASSNEKYVDAFEAVMEHLQDDRTCFIDEESQDQFSHFPITKYLRHYANGWQTHSLHSGGSALFTHMVDALDFVNWTKNHSLYAAVDISL